MLGFRIVCPLESNRTPGDIIINNKYKGRFFFKTVLTQDLCLMPLYINYILKMHRVHHCNYIHESSWHQTKGEIYSGV